MNDDSCGPGCCHALGPCTCATDGNASRCVHHTQEDFDAAERTREGGVRVQIDEALGEPTTCKVWRDGVLLFSGVSIDALTEVPSVGRGPTVIETSDLNAKVLHCGPEGVLFLPVGVKYMR